MFARQNSGSHLLLQKLTQRFLRKTMVFVALSFSIKAYVADCIAVQIYRMKICQAGESTDVTDRVAG